MQLPQRDLTPAEEITLPAYPGIFVATGVLLFLQAPSRTSSGAFATAKLVMPDVLLRPIQWWGVVFLLVGIGMAGAFIRWRPSFYRRLLVVGAGLAGFWAALILKSGFDSPLVSFTGVVWVAGTALFQAASARALGRRDHA